MYSRLGSIVYRAQLDEVECAFSNAKLDEIKFVHVQLRNSFIFREKRADQVKEMPAASCPARYPAARADAWLRNLL